MADSALWAEVSFVVDMRVFRHLLKKKVVNRRRKKPRPPPAPTRRSDRLIGKYAESTLDKSLSQLSLQSISEDMAYSRGSSSTRVFNAASYDSGAEDGTIEQEDEEDRESYYIFPYEFWMAFDGILAKFKLRCPINGMEIEAERNMTAIYEAGTC